MIMLVPYCMLGAIRVQCRQELAVNYRKIDMKAEVLPHELLFITGIYAKKRIIEEQSLLHTNGVTGSSPLVPTTKSLESVRQGTEAVRF